MKDRVLWKYSQNISGPLVIALGGIHGNEHAGVKALELLHKMLEVEPIRNPGFTFCGQMIAVLGNQRAYDESERFIDIDLNRIWSEEAVLRARNKAPDERLVEEVELLEVLDVLETEFDQYDGDEIILLDLHTTSAPGGIFSIVPDNAKIIELAVGMHAPVITGFSKAILGTSIDYWNREYAGKYVHCLAFESGQHDHPRSVNMGIAACINLLRFIGCVAADDVENVHDEVLCTFSQGLPKVSELLSSYRIPDGAEFVMMPGFSNFQEVKKDEILAHQDNVVIKAPRDASLLMPRYQKRGTDGFFLIESRSDNYS